MRISVENQVNHVQYFKNYMNELMNHNQTSLRLYKDQIEAVLRKDSERPHRPQGLQPVVTKMLTAVRDFELGLKFFAEAQKLDVKGARSVDKQLKKIDNALMNKQLFALDKLQCMIISEDDGSQTVAEGTDEVTRQYADNMKHNSDDRQQILDQMKWLKKNCQIGILMSA